MDDRPMLRGLAFVVAALLMVAVVGLVPLVVDATLSRVFDGGVDVSVRACGGRQGVWSGR